MKTFLQFIIGIAICLLAAWLLRIDPATDYGWFMGIVHGVLLVPDWIISLFDKTWLLKAPLHTQMYNICWWICGVLNVIYWLWAITGTIMTIASRKSSRD